MKYVYMEHRNRRRELIDIVIISVIIPALIVIGLALPEIIFG